MLDIRNVFLLKYHPSDLPGLNELAERFPEDFDEFRRDPQPKVKTVIDF